MYSLNILFPYLTRLNLRHFIPCHFHSLSEKNSGKKEKRLYLVMLKFDLINTLQPNNCKTGKMKQEPFLAW